MAAPQTTRTRSQRVATVELPPGRLESLLGQLRRGAVVLRLAMAALACLALVIITRGWDPPPDFAPGDVPSRDLTAQVEFSRLDERATREARDRARRIAEAVYDNDPALLTQLAAQVKNEVARLAGAVEPDEEDLAIWARYAPPRAEGTPEPSEDERLKDLEEFRAALADDDARVSFSKALDETLAPLEQRGLLAAQPTDANAQTIIVRRSGREGFEQVVPVREALIGNARNDLDQSLRRLMPSLDLARHAFARINPELPITLTLDEAATREQANREAAEVEPVYERFQPGDRLAVAGEPLGETQLDLLQRDYEEFLAQRSVPEVLLRGLSVFWLDAVMLALCGIGLYRANPEAIFELPRYTVLLATLLVAVGAMVAVSGSVWRLELIPLLLLGMTLAIAYRHQSAVLLTATAGLSVAIASGWSLGETAVAVAPSIAAISLLDSVRHRSKLLMVGFGAAVAAILTTLAVGALQGQPAWPMIRLAVATGLWCVVAGALLTVSLQLVEWAFRVQTDWSLIELGDPAHPLLQELVRRAPGTYNHSITVASIAEAAAESIGARGLLVRVGAYFHDIGKMLKPGYFIENQGQSGNQHDALVPAMSTLVIIAHVKDGADLARQNHLPQCIIDFIEQHHGTTLVEYFYRQAQKKSAEQDAKVDESRFRYPGPKPQTREAAVLMLADAVESASRALVEPTPSRIENLVEDLTRKRLDDGQLDECGITLQEVHTVGESLIKSLTAVYHGRVKYPDQETA